MTSRLSLNLPKKFRALFWFLLIVIAAYFISKLFPTEAQKVPPAFKEAKYNASLFAKEIVELTGGLTTTLNEVNRLDAEKKYTEAINLLAQAGKRNEEAKEKAIKLSEELAKMALAVPEISPVSASQIAIQAISSETTLISRLIAYNDYLNQLLEELRLKLLGKSANSGKIQELILKINEEVRAINELNNKFNNLMKRFGN